jgi:phage terminase large subunit-like protein
MPRLRRRALSRKEDDPLEKILAGSRGADRVITFCRKVLTHGKGEFAGQPFNPLPFQESVFRGIFDPLTPEGLRRIRNALLFWPRRQGKSTTCAALGLYGTFCGEIGARAVVAANSRDQAGELFTTAADMVEASDVLRPRAVVSRAKKQIYDRVTRSTLKAISADAATNHGQDLSLWVYDELHGAPSRELFDVLSTSTGSRREPLGIAISTAGFDKLSVLGELYDHAKRCLQDPTLDPSFYASIFEADEGDEWDAEATWYKSNPALGVYRSLEEMRILAARAKQIPSLRDAFERLYLNRWTAAERTWLDMAAWDSCGDNVPDADLAGLSACGGLDLSATTDLTAFCLAFPLNGRLYVRHWAWIPEEGLRERELRDRVPYRRWAAEGRITLTPGNAVDYDFIVAKVIELAGRHNIRSINFDRWGAAQVVQQLQSAGIEVFQMGQGYAHMNAPCKELERAVLARRLAHGGCPLLRWQASCCSIASDPAGNIKPVKPSRLRSSRRIDSIVALVMALDGIMQTGETDLTEFLANPVVLG